ncbi:hypothetical protein OCK74_05340 [Chitinophagaceae bacterium LB-8]|uniref:Lipoprotein n=1 Tax=Paraflavisolibacter caeni TaxID=2982496 RepID=A0A9X3BH66_9BACT|nr:hypothetical protein [Paraflavisolibacter caeni]MCU7548528.1 hypothetical protein [Paraflavisolibacter caeni]
MNKLIFTSLLCCALLYSCKSKQKEGEEPNEFFPVLSFLKSQVAHIDTSFYQIIKVQNENGHSDTAYIKREEFKTYARDFFSIPDLSSDDLKDEYTETKLYDDAINRVVLSYSPKKVDGGIQRQDITISPSGDSSKVETIYIDWVDDKGDSVVHKKMFWQMDKSFQIITSISKPEQPERLKTLQVSWRQFAPAE